MQRMKCCLSSLWVVDAVDGDDPFEGPWRRLRACRSTAGAKPNTINP